MREKVGEEKLAVRCSPQELKAMDSYVLAGDFRNRSALVRTAIQQFLEDRLREMSNAPAPVAGPIANLTPEETELLGRFAERVHGGKMGDAIAQCVRYGLASLRVDEMVRVGEKRLMDAPVVTRPVTPGESDPEFSPDESTGRGRHPSKRGGNYHGGEGRD